jgi:transposase
VEDAPRSGRPKCSDVVIQHILDTMLKNSTTRGYSCQKIASIVSAISGIALVSASTVYRVLIFKGYSSYKKTVKPGLNKDNKKVRFDWCKKHEHWTLEDWKNVIWTDETAVQSGSVRGKRRIWRLPSEVYHHHVCTQRWKGYMTFMWWSAFSYDKKGPYYIWPVSTPAETKEMKDDLAARNAARYESDKLDWEMANGIRRLRVDRNMPGTKPQFKHDEDHGAYVVKDGKGGINWWRHQKHVLKPLLLPFAQECKKDRPETLVMEDGATAHSSRYALEVYNMWEIQKMLWPANSPDLNVIEPCWFWMKRETTKKGPIFGEKELREAWIKCWEETLTQERIQAWIERIIVHVKEVIRLEGGNEYKEGRNKGQEKRRVH